MSDMQFLFCCGRRTSRNGCLCCSLKLATLLVSFFGILFAIPIIVSILDLLKWNNYNEVPIIFVIYEAAGCIAPILMFIGCCKMDFSLCYIGYFMHSIYIYGLIIFVLFMGIFFGTTVMPGAYPEPNYPAYYASYFVAWTVYMLILLYFNNIYYSFSKHLGAGDVATCEHRAAFIIPQDQIYVQP